MTGRSLILLSLSPHYIHCELQHIHCASLVWTNICHPRHSAMRTYMIISLIGSNVEAQSFARQYTELSILARSAW